MSRYAQRLINRAIADLHRCTSGNTVHRAINTAYATGMIEVAYAESLLTDAEYDDLNRQVHQAVPNSREVASA